MTYFYAVVTLLAGLGAFLLGFRLLSDNMEKLASGGLKKMFSKTAGNKIIGVGIGAASTVIVQSSSVTTVMVVGFVNAGVMSLYQATAVIMGANIGTTITAQIVALQSFDFVEIATVLTAVGVFMNMFCKKDVVKTVGFTLAGLGLVFIGLKYMGNAMNDFKENGTFAAALASVSNPFLLFLVGLGVTALVQSSSAVTSIVISMASAGMVIGSGGNSVLFLILGTNVGTCITAILSAIGASRNARRACIIHLLFNFFGSVLFFIPLLIWRGFMDATFAKWFVYPGQQIAMFHTFFNVVCTLIFLPFCNLFVRLSGILVPEKKRGAKEEKRETLMDERLLLTPSVALEQLEKECLLLADKSMKALQTAMEGYFKKDESAGKEVLAENEEIAVLNREITDYLIRISAQDISVPDEQTVSRLHHNLGDIVRIAELADNVTKYTRRMVADEMSFSSGVDAEVGAMAEKLVLLYGEVRRVLEKKDTGDLEKVDAIEEEIDSMRTSLINEHIERLNGGYCKAENSSVFINLVSNLERVGDHLTYLAHSLE